jgi:hypothetical protein
MNSAQKATLAIECIIPRSSNPVDYHYGGWAIPRSYVETIWEFVFFLKLSIDLAMEIAAWRQYWACLVSVIYNMAV